MNSRIDADINGTTEGCLGFSMGFNKNELLISKKKLQFSLCLFTPPIPSEISHENARAKVFCGIIIFFYQKKIMLKI